MNGRKIVVVMGGPSAEAEISRRSGAAVLRALREKGRAAEGLEFSPASFCADIEARRPAVVFNAMHGAFGEDGRLQAMLDWLGVPYTGSGMAASAIAMDKAIAKRVLLGAGIPTPRAEAFRRFERSGLEARIAASFALPVVVKAARQGSSLGVVIAKRAEDVPGALDAAFRYDDEALAEEFIDGTELTAAVLGDPRRAEVLPVIEITTASGRYDYASKYTPGASRHVIPARIDEAAMARARETALRTFRVFGCRGAARVDMMLSKDGVPYVIDINTVPGMTDTSLVPDAARAAGLSFGDFCERLLAAARFADA